MDGWTKLHASTTQSLKIGNLIDEEPEAFILFTLMIAKAGVWGRFPAHPKLLKGIVAPLSDRLSAQKITELLAVLENSTYGLVTRYEVDGQEYLYNTGHFENNPDQSWHRVGKLELPHPPDWSPPPSLVLYLAKVREGVYKGKKFMAECVKFCISPQDVPTLQELQSQDDSQEQSRDRSPDQVPQTTDVRRETSDFRHETKDKATTKASRARARPPAFGSPDAPPEPEPEPEPPSLNPQQQAIQDAYEAFGLQGVATDPPGAKRNLYSGLTAAIAAKGIPLVQEWVNWLRDNRPQAIPEGAKRWPYFCSQFHKAMNQPWTWQGSNGRSRASPRLPKRIADTKFKEGRV
jgi:hypothetical protein